MLLFQIFIVIIQFFTYFLTAPRSEISLSLVASSILLSLTNIVISFAIRKKAGLGKKNFSIVLFFYIMSFIICFQIPLEISLGNYNLLSYNFIYNTEILNKMIAYSALILSVFSVGCSISYQRACQRKLIPNDLLANSSKIKTTPLFILLLGSFLMFILNVDSSYIDGGHGTVKFEGIGFSFLGIFIRLSIVYLSIILYNNRKMQVSSRAHFKSFLGIFNKGYLLFIIITVAIFFLAHNRVFVVFTFVPLVFGYFVFTKKNVGISMVLLIYFGLSVFGTLFKLYGIDNLFDSGLAIQGNIVISKSYFPFTAELASSIYSQSILFYNWLENDLFLFGYSYLVGLLRVFPGLMGLLSIPPIEYDTAVIATTYSGANYGLGTTSIVDVLINFGFLGSCVLFLYLGYFFSRTEVRVYTEQASVRLYIIYFSITSLILFIPRASINDLLATIIFNLMFFRLYSTIYPDTEKKHTERT